MLGTLSIPATAISKLLAVSEEALRARRAMSPAVRKHLKSVHKRDKTKEVYHPDAIRFLRRAAALSEQFPVVQFDDTAKRKMKVRHSTTIEAPLLFYAQLPLKPTTTIRHYESNYGYNLTSRTPQPTKKAIKALKDHGKKFDRLQLWWVPNDVLVEKIPDPDPILVGIIDMDKYGSYSFELARWVDESVEAGYWAKEGY